MLPGLGVSEILLLGVVALLVVGPKDLPMMLRELGKWTRKLQGMANEFRQGFDELARQAELDELRKEVEDLRNSAMIPVNELESAMTTATTPAEGDATAATTTDTPVEPTPGGAEAAVPSEEIAQPAPRPSERIETA